MNNNNQIIENNLLKHVLYDIYIKEENKVKDFT